MLTFSSGLGSFILLLVLSSSGCRCEFLVRDLNPPNGTTVVDLPGSTVTFNCSVYSNSTGMQAITEWKIGDIGQTATITIASVLTNQSQLEFDGAPLSATVGTIINTRNVLILPQYNLHNKRLQCSFGLEVFAEYFLFTYRTPHLSNMTDIRVLSGTEISFSMKGNSPPAYPYPTFTWTHNGNPVSNSSLVTFGYPTITFSSVNLLLSGTFILSASNYYHDDSSRILGSDSGYLTLDVLYGPSIRRGDSQRATMLGESLSLLCGDQLRSNPTATVSWQHPNGSVITDSSHHTLVNNALGVKLDLATTNPSDNGLWTCSIVVSARDVTLSSNGTIASTVQVGEEIFQINVFIVDAPGSPTNLLVEDIGGTWASLTWTEPRVTGLQGISFYVVTARNMDLTLPDLEFMSLGNKTEVNMTNLLPVTTYNFTVQAVSKALTVEVRGQSSSADSGTTLVSTPAPTCTSAVESNGGIRVRYSFIHTGGQDISMVAVSYIATEISGNVMAWDGPAVDVNSTNVFIPDLVAGNAYTVVVMATNLNGSSEANCPVLNLTIGLPQSPSKPIVTELEVGNVVKLQVQIFFPGSQNVHFIVTPVLVIQHSENPGQEIRKSVDGYAPGKLVEIIVPGLASGGEYIFRVKIENEFGSSSSADSDPIIIQGSKPTSSSFLGTTFYIVVGVVGSLVVLSVIIIVVVLIVIAMLRRSQRHKAYGVPQKNGGNETVGNEYYESHKDQVRVVLRERTSEKEEVIENELYENLGTKRIEALRPSYYESSLSRTPEPQMTEMTEVVEYMNVTATSSALRPSHWD